MTESIKRGAVNEVTPEMFGAIGDGVTDDTVAINAAASAAREYGIPFHFTRDYYVTDSLNFTGGPAGWKIYGNGQCITNIYANLSTQHPVMDFTGVQFLNVSGLHVEGKSQGQQTAGILLAMDSTGKGVIPILEHIQIDGTFSKAGVANISADMSELHHCHIFGPVGVVYGQTDVLGVGSKYKQFTTLPGQNTMHNIFGGGIQGIVSTSILADTCTGAINVYGCVISLRGTATSAIKVTGDHAKIFWYGCRSESISSAPNTYVLHAEKAPQYSHFSGAYAVNGVGPFFYIPAGQYLQNAFIQIDPMLGKPGQSPATALMVGGGGYIRNCVIYNGKGINAELQTTGNNNNTVYAQGCEPWTNFIVGHVMNVWYGATKLYIGGDLKVSRKLYVGNREL